MFLLLTFLFANLSVAQNSSILTTPPITSCSQLIADHVVWLKATPLNYVEAFVASNESLPAYEEGQVTYARITLKTAFNTLLTSPVANDQYFSDRKWGEPCSDPQDFCPGHHPFSPYATETIAMTAHSIGSIYLSTHSGKKTNTFMPLSCTNGVIVGKAGRTGYVITLKKGTGPR
jgi:hypothetical protein